MGIQTDRIRIGITQGDPNGVGIEVIVKALSNPDILDLFTPVVFANGASLRQALEMLQPEEFRIKAIKEIEEAEDGFINVLEVGDPHFEATPGIASVEGGTIAVEVLEGASKAVEEGGIDLLVTAPIDKNTAHGEKFDFAGHTEYLAGRFGVEPGKAQMILADDGLRVALVTTHLPLKEIPGKITREKVADAIKNFNMALKMDFGCERPKIAVLSLNPHNGDGGVLGTEEIEVISPAIEECRDKGILAFGPIAADGLFGSGGYKNFDGILAMYHDQGLAPFKALSRGGGVNFTAGLNIIRTSPAHGTAYDIAGKGTADETSMREAIYAAIDIARRRDRYLDASENPLKIREIPHREKRNRERQEDEKLPEADDTTE